MGKPAETPVEPPAEPGRTESGAGIGEVGQRIRHLRKLKRMRLKDLAAAVGCSESLLSKVELNRATPSLRMLHRIMAELGSNIAALFSESSAEEVRVYRAEERPIVRIAGTDGAPGIRLERLAPVDADHILEANIHEVDPGANNGGDIKHEGEEVGYVLAGELELTVGERIFRLSKGDSFHFRSELPHSYRNPGRAVARILWVNTPPTF